MAKATKQTDVKKLREELRKKELQIETLSKVAGVLSSDMYLKEILDLIVSMTAQMMDSKICSIMLLNEDNDELIIMATQSLSELYRNKPSIKIGKSISGIAVKEKRPVTVSDVTNDQRYMYPDIAKKEGLVSMVSVPMMVKNKVIGVINSYTSKKHKFTGEEIRVLQAVANQAAVTIENTKLFDKARAMEEALEARKLIERAKGILTREHSISEDAAFRMIQKESMDSRKSMRDIAEAIVLAAKFKKA
ncbi:MAG: GAF and ANTAR domain-containing protein [Candidatus Omnitrophota bacterium]